MYLHVAHFIALTALSLLFLPLPLASGDAAAELASRHSHRGAEEVWRSRELETTPGALEENTAEQYHWRGAFTGGAGSATRHHQHASWFRPRGAQMLEDSTVHRRWPGRNAHPRHLPRAPFVGPSSLMAERQHASRRVTHLDVKPAMDDATALDDVMTTPGLLDADNIGFVDSAPSVGFDQDDAADVGTEALVNRLPRTARVASEAPPSSAIDTQPALRRAVALLKRKLRSGREALRETERALREPAGRRPDRPPREETQVMTDDEDAYQDASAAAVGRPLYGDKRVQGTDDEGNYDLPVLPSYRGTEDEADRGVGNSDVATPAFEETVNLELGGRTYGDEVNGYRDASKSTMMSDDGREFDS